MTLKKRISFYLVGSALLIGGVGIGESLNLPVVSGFVTEAEAVIGMPLTPISVAGVARRTARRTIYRECAMGYGYC